MEEQTEYYNTLISEGGQPSHPVSLGRDILENPGEYCEILSYWQFVKGDAENRVWKVFGSQMGEWLRFKKNQQAVREQDRLLKYTESAKHRLPKYGFTQSFQFHEDPERQDKLTTWIEFLNYEYRKYENETDTIKRLQPQFDEAWKKLVESEVLRPLETAESLWDLTSVIQRQNERHEAEDAVERATLTVKAAEKAFQEAQCASLSGQSLSQIEEKLSATRSQLAALTASLEQINRRSDLIGGFKDQTKRHRRAEKNINSQNILLRWILQQVPSIELELNSAEATEDGSDTRNGGRRGLKRNRANDLNEEKVSKRQRLGVKNNQGSYRRTRASTAQGPKRQPNRNRHNSIDEGSARKQSRYNGQNNNLSHRKTSNRVNPTLIAKPLSTQLDRSQDSGVARGAKARSIRLSTTGVLKIRSESDDSAIPILRKSTKGQPKVYKKERESRRIAGRSPEFGMLPKRGEPAPPYESPWRHPSNTRKPNPSGARSRASSNKSVAVKGAKPQGISKSGREGTNRPKGSRKQSGG